MSFLFFIDHPITTLTFTLMILSIISMWMMRRIYIWGTLLLASCASAWIAGIINGLALIPIVILFACHYGLSFDLSKWSRFFLVTVAAVVSFGMNAHLVKGFYNPLVINGMQVSPDAFPLKWYLNFDKPFTGLFVLGLYLPLIRGATRLLKISLMTFSWTILSVLVLLGWSYYSGLIAWDMKWYTFFPLFLLLNFFLVVIPEEAFYRGFLQREITMQLKNRASGLLAILVVSLLFAGMHLLFVPSWSFFIASLLASFFYGGIFLLTGAIESSIITHFCINALHLFFFTYPALRSL